LRGRARRVRPRIRRRFARCKITLMKIDYQARTIRITLKLGEYLSIPWKSTWFEHRVRGWAVGEAIIFDDKVVIPFKAPRRSMLEGLLDGIATRLLLDGYEPSIGFIHVDLKPLQSIKIVYKRKKAIAQSKG
jgi:putative transposase